MTRAVLRSVWTGFWLLPSVCVLFAIAVASVLVEVDQHWVGSPDWLFPGGADGARSLLSAVTSSMISFTGLVFSITIVALQLTSSQFSPRALRRFVEDRVTQAALGVFVATFVYTMTVLRAVRGESVVPFVPRLSTTTAFGFVLLSVAMFIYYINHIANSLQAANILATIGDQTRRLLERQFPFDSPSDPPSDGPPADRALPPVTRRVRADCPGVVTSVEVRRLVRLAQRYDAVLELEVPAGRFVPTGAPLVAVRFGAESPADRDDGLDDGLDDRQVRRGVAIGVERTMLQDVGYGFRQLVDIAERALSPSMNDLTTAVQAIDQLHDLLRRLVTRPFPSLDHYDGNGRLRLVLPRPPLADFLHLAVDEITHWGQDAPRVQDRISALLADLAAVARPEHRRAVREAMERHERAAGRAGPRAGS